MPGSKPASTRRRWKRLAIIVASSLLVIGVALIALAPTIASWVAPGIIRRSLAGSIEGTLEVGSARLGWSGPQKVRGIVVTDAQGERVADIEIESDAGLFGLVLGSRDLGTIKLSGEVNARRGASGAWNLTTLAKRSGQASSPRPAAAGAATSGGGKLPKGLKAAIAVEGLGVTLDDAISGENVRLAGVNASGSYADGSARLEIEARASRGAGAPAELGRLEATITASELTADGALTLNAARFDATLSIKDASPALARLFATIDDEWIEALGDRVEATFKASGTRTDATAEAHVASAALDADLAIALRDRAITLPRTGRVEIKSERLASLIHPPSTAQIRDYPRLTLELASLRANLPAGGGVDLRGVSFDATLGVSEASAMVQVPGLQSRSLARMSPLSVRIRSDDLASGATVAGGTALTLDDQPAGEISLDATIAGLVDDAGVTQAGAPMIDGTLRLRGVATAIAQPLVDSIGLELASAVGPSVDAELRASVEPGSSSSRVGLRVNASNLNAAGEAIVGRDGAVAATTPIEVRVGTVAPFLAITPAAGKIEIASGGGVLLRVSEARLEAGAVGSGIDLRRVGGVITISTPPTAGVLRTARDAAPRAWQAAASTATIDARDLARGVSISGASSLTFEGKPAGTLTADGAIAELLDAAGRPRAMPGSLRGTFEARDVATAMAQPVLDKLAPTLGLDLPRDVGPSLSLRVTADAASDQRGRPRTDLDASLTSQGVSATASITIDVEGVRSRGQGVRLSAPAAGRIASVLTPSGAGVVIEPSGSVTLTASSFNAPFSSPGVLALDHAAADASIKGAQLAAHRIGADGAPGARIELRGLDLALTLASGADPRLSGSIGLASDGDPFSIDADLRAAGIWLDGALDAARARPIGSLAIKNAPASLVAWARAKGSLDLESVLAATAGPTVSVTIESKAVGTGARTTDHSSLEVSARLMSATLDGAVAALVSDAAIDLRPSTLTATLSPAAAQSIADALGASKAPTLASPATIEASLAAVRVPRDEAGMPDIAHAGVASVELRAPGRILVQGLTPEVGAGPVGVERLIARASFPLASLTSGAAAAQASASITGAIVGGSDAVGAIDGRASISIAGGKPSGPLTGSLAINDADTTFLDVLAGKPGLASGALGPTVTLSADARGGIDAGVLSKLDASVLVRSERVSMPSPIALELEPGVGRLASPARVDWRIDPAWANRYLPTQTPRVGEPPPPEVVVAEPIAARVDLWKLTFGRGSTAPFSPGVFAFDGQLSTPTLALDGAGVLTRFADVSARMQGGHAPGGVIGFSIETKGAGEAGQPRQGAIKLAGAVHGAITDAGALDPSSAALTARGDVWNLPTPILDALARQNGLLVDVLGPAVTVNVVTQGLSRAAGSIEARAVSPRASATLRGGVRDGVFVASQPIVATLVEITPETGARLIRVLPLLGTFEKKLEDGPARVTISTLELPIDGRLERLNGAMRIEVGTARFLTSGLFQAILLATDQRSQGMLGRRVEPVNVAMTNGVVTYERFKVPVGEFSFETRGSVNLVRRELDVVAYFPIGALTDEAAGVFNTNLGKNLTAVLPGGLTRLTMVPYRITGPLSSPTSQPDLELFGRELFQQLRPDNLLKDLLGGGRNGG